MDESVSGGILTIDCGALRANYALLRARLGGAECAAVVKADGYGLGAAPVARALAREGCRTFFVATLEEACALRPHLPHDAALFVLHSVSAGAEAECMAQRAVPVLNSLPQLAAWQGHASRLGRALPAGLHVDTGMARLGLSAADLDGVALHGIAVRLAMSHLACAEHQDHPLNPAQRERFRAARDRLPAAPASLANSSGIFLGPEFHFDLARPGAALYGLAPVAGRATPMQPVVRLHGAVVQVRTIPPGASVGYGASWTAPLPSRIATVAVGYADGYPRTLSNRACAAIAGVLVPQVGTVSMDSCTFDVSALPEYAVQPGTLAELIGPHVPIETVAEAAGTIPYEILTRLGNRYARRYVDVSPPEPPADRQPANVAVATSG